MLSLLPLSSCRSITAPAPPQPAAGPAGLTLPGMVPGMLTRRLALAGVVRVVETRTGMRIPAHSTSTCSTSRGLRSFAPRTKRVRNVAMAWGLSCMRLWPQDLSGDYPEDCSDAPGPANPQTYTDLLPTASLVEHEWQTHGTCSGLAADAYFAEIRKAFSAVKVPADLGAGADADGVSPIKFSIASAARIPHFHRRASR